MEHRLGLTCFNAKILRLCSLKAVCFGMWRTPAWSLCIQELARWVTWTWRPVPWIMSRLAVNAAFGGLSKWLNSHECQTLFLNRVCCCQVCHVNTVFCDLSSKDRRVDEGLGRAQVNLISRNLRRQGDTILCLEQGVPGRRLEYFNACFSLFNWKKKCYVKCSWV